VKTVEMADAAAAPLSDLVHQALSEPIVIMLGGRPVAALTAVAAATDLENLIVGTDPAFRALIARSRETDPAGAGLSTSQVRRLLRQRGGRPRAGPTGKRSAVARKRRTGSR